MSETQSQRPRSGERRDNVAAIGGANLAAGLLLLPAMPRMRRRPRRRAIGRPIILGAEPLATERRNGRSWSLAALI